MKSYRKRDDRYTILELEEHDSNNLGLAVSKKLHDADVIFIISKIFSTKYVKIFKSRWFTENIMSVENFLIEMEKHTDPLEYAELTEAFTEKKSRRERIEKLDL